MRRLALLAGLLVACQPQFQTGRVLSKWYEEALTYQSSMICQPVGQTQVCTPIYTYDDEDWMVRVENVLDAAQVADWELDPQRWDSVQVGEVLSR